MIRKFLKQHFFELILAILVGLIGIINYQPGTWLTGWDNLHSEFNFSFNIKRNIFAVWQEYQGLGLVGGMGHASDLPRQIFLWFCSLVLPTSFLRYFYTFLMLGLGPLGVYFLIRELKRNNLIAFLGALFYLFNLVTVQIFYTPFETFTTHYGFLPWLILVFIKFLDKPSRKNLFWFILVNLLSIPQFYVPTMFLVYLLILGLVFLGRFRLRQGYAGQVGKFVRSLAIVFILNSFWLLPFLYFNLTSIQNPRKAHTNFMSTEDMFLRNQKFGNLSNTALLRNFWFDYIEVRNGEYQYLVGGWRQHLANPYVLAIGYGLFGVVLIGVFNSLKRKPKYWLSFLLLFLFSFTLLASETIPFSWINFFWRKIPLVAQVFRVPFTKFGNLACLSYSVFFALGVDWLMGKLGKKLALMVFGLMMIVFVWPIFTGHLTDETLKLKIPQEYFDLFQFFQNQDGNTRVANLPQPTFWGWDYYNWGYHGSGFLWYGVGQPILDRAFDVWSREDENFYWEISQAIYSQDLVGFEAILEKYQINFLVLDKNVRSYGNYHALYLDKTEEMFAKSKKIRASKDFPTSSRLRGTSDEIRVYQIDLETPVKDFVFLANDLAVIGPEYIWNDQDIGFKENSHYVTESQKSKVKSQNEIYYPFRSLFTGRQQDELEFAVEEGFNSIIFSNKILSEVTNFQLLPPSLSEDEAVFWTKDLTEEKATPPEVQVVKEKVAVRIDKQKGYFSYDSQDTDEIFKAKTESCDPFNIGLMERKTIEENGKKLLRLTSVGSSNCLTIDLPYLSQKTGYLVKVESRHLKGKSLLFSINNKTSKKSVIETYLPTTGSRQPVASYFIIPPMEEYGVGYSLHFDNISIGRQKTVNDLGRVEVYPIPYRFLKGIKLQSITTNNANPPAGGEQITINNVSVSHPNPSFYKVSINNEAMKQGNNGTIVLSQSYHPGWIAFQVQSSKFKVQSLEHILVNNWANGWALRQGFAPQGQITNETMTIYIFFWPQVLEYLGFGLLIAFGVWLVFRK